MKDNISFQRESSADPLYSTMRDRVSNYLKVNGLESSAGRWQVFQSIIFLNLFVISYYLIIAGVASGFGVIFAYGVLGFFAAICAINISHDSVHNSYVTSSWGNRILAYFIDLTGPSSYLWKTRHVVNHHTYTNIFGHDMDIDSPDVLRLCPSVKHHPILRFQHLYWPFLYALKLLEWIYIADTVDLIEKFKSVRRCRGSFSEIGMVVVFKVVHISLMVVLPMFFAEAQWWQIILGYVFYSMVAGFTVSIIFQLAHVTEGTVFPLPGADGKISMSFARHQLSTTCNFGVNSRLLRIICGGLNFQVEHHLFPHLHHSVLYKIAPIVKATALEFNAPYHEHSSFYQAVCSHVRTLKKLGRIPDISL